MPEPTPIRPLAAAWTPTPAASQASPHTPGVAAETAPPGPAAVVGLAVAALGLLLALVRPESASGSLVAPVGFLVALVATRGTRQATGRQGWLVAAAGICTCLSVLLT